MSSIGNPFFWFVMRFSLYVCNCTVHATFCIFNNLIILNYSLFFLLPLPFFPSPFFPLFLLLTFYSPLFQLTSMINILFSGQLRGSSRLTPKSKLHGNSSARPQAVIREGRHSSRASMRGRGARHSPLTRGLEARHPLQFKLHGSSFFSGLKQH